MASSLRTFEDMKRPTTDPQSSFLPATAAVTVQERTVRELRIVGPAGADDIAHDVACPEQGRTVDFARCCGCPRRVAIHARTDREPTIDCRTSEAPSVHGRTDVAEAAIRSRLLDIVGPHTVCVRPELSLIDAADLFAREGLRAAPVVDPDGGLIGMLSRTDLSKKRKATVADVMATLVHGLPEEAPVAYAISLMARDAIHEVPLVDPKGRVVGMVSAIDALRWVAVSLGYVMP